jgi:hypothetical protein
MALVVILLVILVFFGLMALVFDVGYIMSTQTQMQAAVDSAALAGATELLDGVGRFATKTPSQVEAAARTVATQFAGYHPNGNQANSYADPSRDITFGHADFAPATGRWTRSWGTDFAPYNMITVTLRRDQEGSANADAPLPLFFARLIGFGTQKMAVDATAVVMPANGFRGKANSIIPFAYRDTAWARMQQAQAWYMVHHYIPTSSSTPEFFLFHSQKRDNQGQLVFDKKTGLPVYEQDVFDNYAASPVDEPAASVTENAPDGWLEVNMYPQPFVTLAAGNAGTVDLGDTNNAATALGEQILHGLSAADFAAMEAQGQLTDGAFILDGASAVTVEANSDTGISGGPIDHAFQQIIGHWRVMELFTDPLLGNSGGTVYFPLTQFAGVRIMDVKMQTPNKYIFVQMAPILDGDAVADLDTGVGDNTTVFAPLILIE